MLLLLSPQTGYVALRAEFSSLSFPKEKETKKKENLRAAPLKIPLIVQSCYAQSRTGCLLSPQLRVALRHPFGQKIVRSRKKKQRVCTDITSSAHEPSALDRRSQCNLNRRSSVARGRCHEVTDEVRPCGSMGVCAVTILADIALSATFSRNTKFHFIKTCHYGSAYCVGGTSSTAHAVPLPLEGKASLRI